MSGAAEMAGLGYCLVTGGSGFLGRHLVEELLARGARVRAFDLATPHESHERLDAMQGDVRDPVAVRKACDGIDTVFHTAAVFDFRSFAPRSERERAWAVNVTGVENVLRACHEAGVRRLVHTSSNNVTFTGELLGGDETLPYAENRRDLYTRTKIAGEKAVLAANGSGGLLTCAIRPGGIWGVGEEVMLPRFVEQCVRGLPARMGDPEAKSDNTYIDNLVDAEIAAALHLVPGSPSCGEAYFIFDGTPINYFDFFRPFAAALGQEIPKRSVPTRPIAALTWIWELLHRFRLAPRPALTHLEIQKLAVSHYGSIAKAKRDLGWQPSVSVEEGTRRCLPYALELARKVEVVDRPHWAYWLAIPFGMGLLAVLAFSPGAHAAWESSVTSWTPRWLLQGIFVWAALLHVYKGMKAVRIAERAGLRDTSLAWGWQTFVLGFPSLGLLEKRARLRARSDDSAALASEGD